MRDGIASPGAPFCVAQVDQLLIGLTAGLVFEDVDEANAFGQRMSELFNEHTLSVRGNRRGSVMWSDLRLVLVGHLEIVLECLEETHD